MRYFIGSLKSSLPQRLALRAEEFFWNTHWKLEALKQQYETKEPAPQLRGSERAMLAEALSDYHPFSSLLEVGCGFGQNFHTIAPLFPNSRMVGIDANKESVEAARELLEKKRIRNVEIQQGEAINLSAFSDNSFDIVISVACLLYVGANEIEAVITEMLRVARRAILLVEQHQEKPFYIAQAFGSFVPEPSGMGGYWLRDYYKLLARFVPEPKIILTPIPSPLFNSEQWQAFGYLIEAEK